MKIKPLLETALLKFDQVGYRLDEYGIASNINRHQVIAHLMAEQKRLEGECDSLKARVGVRRFQVERIIGRVENSARNGVELALMPAHRTLVLVRGFFKKS